MHDEAFAAGLGNPVQAQVDAHELGHVVVLDARDPAQLRRERDVGAKLDEPRDEAALRQVDVVPLVAEAGAQAARRPPVDLGRDLGRARRRRTRRLDIRRRPTLCAGPPSRIDIRVLPNE